MSAAPRWRAEARALSHVGMRRKHNEDAWLIDDDQRLYAVADGMGGHNSGEIASRIAIDTLAAFFRATSRDEEITWPLAYDRALDLAQNRLKCGAVLANGRIREAGGRNDLYKGMGTTLVGLHLDSASVHVVNIGDSRCYRMRDGRLERVSEDHSLLNDLIRNRRLQPQDAASFPHKNVILRALGIHPVAAVDLFRLDPQDGDRFLLCSDGLSDMVNDERIDEVLRETADLDAALRALVRLANERGGVDNITGVLLRLVDDASDLASASADELTAAATVEMAAPDDAENVPPEP